MSITPDRARHLVSRFPDQRILVVGDLMLDRYVYGEVTRISPEAPVPVVHVTREAAMPGGSSNVAANVRSLGGEPMVGGLLGRDRAADELRAILAEGGVRTDALVEDAAGATTVKTRVIAERQQVVRVDREQARIPAAATVEALCRAVREAVPWATGVVIEDYGKGVVQQVVVDAALDAARVAGIPVGFDPKENRALRIEGVTVATPNRREAFLAAGLEDQRGLSEEEDREQLRRLGRALYAAWRPEGLLITLGPKGMLLVHDGEPVHEVPTRASEVFDVSGAGDTVIATAVLALAAGGSFIEAAELANYAAGIVVGKIGTAPCSAEELLRLPALAGGDG